MVMSDNMYPSMVTEQESALVPFVKTRYKPEYVVERQGSGRVD